MSDEEKRNVEILNNIKEYMQNSIDNGHHKFIYNDLDWDEKCIDIINSIDYFIEKVEKQREEIERLNEIINSRYYHDLKCRELEIEINENWKDKIRGLKEQVKKEKTNNPYDFIYMINELLEEN